MQTEKYVKEPNSAPTHGVLCAQGPCREWFGVQMPQSTWTPNLTLLALVLTNTYEIMSKNVVSRSVSWLTTRGRQTHTHHMDFILNSISHHAHWLHTHLFSITWTLFKPFWPSILGSLLLYLTAYSTKCFPYFWVASPALSCSWPLPVVLVFDCLLHALTFLPITWISHLPCPFGYCSAGIWPLPVWLLFILKLHLDPKASVSIST